MSQDTVEDLKQFILATIIQYTSELPTKDDLRNGLHGLEVKIDQIRKATFDTVIPFIDTANDKFEDHDKRIKRLEHKVA